MLSIKKGLGLLTAFASVAVVGLASGVDADAAALTRNTDLKSYDATITTNAAGENILTTKKGQYTLDEDSVIYSSKSYVITLNNTTPVNIDSIYVKGTLEFRGNGELNAETDDQYGINVGNHLRGFTNTKYGGGKVTGTGTEAGIRVYNEIQMKGGTVEGHGKNFGIWCYNDIKPYYSAVLKGISSEGMGIWAYRDIYSCKGATVSGEGVTSGAYSQIAHIQAEGAGSSITGISHNINSQYSALHAQKEMLRAYDGAVVREEYVNPGFEITVDTPVHVRNNYKTVARNMTNMSKYTWSSDPEGVYNTNDGLLGDPTKPFNSGTITGVRTVAGSRDKTEVTQLKSNGRHEVVFSEAKAKYMVEVRLHHWVNNMTGLGHHIHFVETIEVEAGSEFKVDDYQYDFSFTMNDYEGADTADFVVAYDENGYDINYKYRVEVDDDWLP